MITMLIHLHQQSIEGEIIITVNSEKKELIRRENIDGVNCVVIPVSESDHVKIN